ncbi:MAG TPA: hypothetical protein VN775_08570 [Opitutaceae bacterium]|nr:hypothetical protein [Opitutaceae bacterium]
MSKSIHPWKLSALLLACACLNLHAQELSLLGGTTTQAGVKNSTYSWQIDYRQDFYKYFASSIAYINEGHLPGHYRDGTAWEAWGNMPLFNDRIALSLGAGVYYFYDTQPMAGDGSADVHGTAPIFSLSVTGYLSDRWFYRFMVNRISPSSAIQTNTATVGVGYWFGQNRRPEGKQPGKEDAAEAGYVTEPQFTVFGGQSVVNTFLSQKALAGAAEYRQGLLPHLDGTASFIYEGDPKIVRRSGVAFQLWPVNTFLNDSTSVGIGVGPYIFVDRNHPVNSGRTVNVGLRNPAAVAPLVSLTIARQLSEHWIARVIWDRVVSNYNRDSDIFLVGLGYRWR